MPSFSQQNDKLTAFVSEIDNRGPWVVVRKAVTYKLPGEKTKIFEPGDNFKIDLNWLNDQRFCFGLFALLSDSKPGKNDAVAVLATSEEKKAVIAEWRAERDRRYKEHAADVAKSKARTNTTEGKLAEQNADLRKEIDNLKKLIEKVAKGAK